MLSCVEGQFLLEARVRVVELSQRIGATACPELAGARERIRDLRDELNALVAQHAS